MSTLVTRSGKGSPLTHNEVDTNFTNLNTDKVEKTAADITGGTINNTTIGATTPSTGVFTTLTAQNETLKGTGQNLILQSQTFTNAYWSRVESTVTANSTTAPDSTSTATTLFETTANSRHIIYASQVVTSTIYTFSIYLKAQNTTFAQVQLAQSGVYFATLVNLSTGAIVSNTSSGSPTNTNSTITSVGNGWYRVAITLTLSASLGSVFYVISTSNSATPTYDGAGNPTYVGNASNGIFIWGSQFELGSVANTYIPTTTTAVYGTPTLSFSGVASIGLQSDGSLYETSAGTGNVRFYTNNIGQEQARVSHTASAVNYVQLTGAATGGYARVTAQGSDTNVPLYLASKNSAEVLVGGSQFTSAAPAYLGTNQVNYVVISGSPTTFGPLIQAAGSDTNVPLVLRPKGTGALQAQQTDFTATGGNARGANAVDWQTTRGAASQVASGAVSFIGAGQNNTSSSYGTVVCGGANSSATGANTFVGAGTGLTASGPYATAVGGAFNTAAGQFNFIGGGASNSGTAFSAVTTQSATMNGTTAVTLSGSNANIKVGQYISGTSIGFGTYVAAISGTSLTLSQAASGSSTSTLSFFTPHGVVVGGGNNQATGAYSAILGGGDAGTAANRNVASGDWGTIGGGRKNVASGAGSTVAGGGTDGANSFSNTASGTTSFIGGGWNNTASGTLSTIAGGTSNNASGFDSFIGGGDNHTGSGLTSAIMGGRRGTTRGLTGYHAFPACYEPLGSTTGAAQGALLVLARQTTDATATVLTSDPNAASTTNQVILPNNSAYAFRGTVIANVTGGGNTKAWAIEGAIKRGANAASTALVGTPTVTSGFADAGASTWAIAVTADTTNGGLAVTFTGQAATTIRCVAKLETTEVTF